MRVAVLSDIHGFSLALEVVLAELERTGPWDEIVVAGDLCETGPDPAGVLARLRATPFAIVQGNTDFDIVEAARMGTTRDALDFAIDEIAQDGVDYLAALPFSHRISPPGGMSPEHDLLVVHANPRNLIERIDPNMSDREIREVIGDERAGAIAFGHIHVCFTRRFDDMLLINVAAVGNSKDGDLRCKFGEIEWNSETTTWSGTIRKLEYPLDATVNQIMSSNLPNPEKVLKKLKKACY